MRDIILHKSYGIYSIPIISETDTNVDTKEKRPDFRKLQDKEEPNTITPTGLKLIQNTRSCDALRLVVHLGSKGIE